MIKKVKLGLEPTHHSGEPLQQCFDRQGSSASMPMVQCDMTRQPGKVVLK